MPEVKTKGRKAVVILAPTLHKKFKAATNKNSTSMAQELRNAAQSYVKKLS